MMTLPEELQADFEQQLELYQEETKMPLLSQIETRATQQEAIRSARESVVEVLEVRFEEVPGAIADTINSIDDVALLKQLRRQAIVISSLEEFEQLLGPEPN